MGLVDIDIRPGAKPLYLVLSSYHPVIWRINGSTDGLSRVVALGSTKEGADLVGVVGVPRDKIEFPKPDFTTYAQGALRGPSVGPSMCDFAAKACAPDTFHFYYPASPSDKSAVIARRISPLLSARGAALSGRGRGAIAAEQIGRENFRTVAAGVLPPEYLAEPQVVDQSLSDASARVSIRSDHGVQIDELVMLAPNEVLSPVEVTPYIVAPGAAGFRQLIAQGAIFDEKSSEFKATVAIWNEARSKPYRSRFDPDFMFPNPQFSYFIAKPLEVLPSSDFGRYLVASTLPIPKYGADPHQTICFAYADGALTGAKDCDPTTQFSAASVSGANGDSVDIQKARLDDIRWFEKATAAERLKVQSAPVAGRSEIDDPVTFRRKYLRGPSATCRLMDVPKAVYSAALTIYSGRSEKPRANTSPNMLDGAGGRLDVVVRRPGDVLLYLNSETGAQWHVSAGPDTRIVGILLRDEKGAVVEKPEGVTVKSIGNLRSWATRSGMDCGAYWPPLKGQLGGPAPLLIDKSLIAITGKGLDLYVARQMPRDIGIEDTSWRQQTDIEQFTTFLVE